MPDDKTQPPESTSPLAPPTSTRRAILNTLRGSSGNLVEWYDVYVYTTFVPFFEKQFFGTADTKTRIYAYAIFAVTFLMRPVGSWFFGRYADRHGRRSALLFSVSVMAACSFIIAIMPTYDTLGIFAAIVLMLCRLVQGFATGGEYGTSATYMSEAATRSKRGFFSSFQYVTLVGGQVLAQLTLLILFAFLTDGELKDWAWRVPFAIGGVAALIVLWLRRSMDESLSEEHLEATRSGADRQSGSLRELFTKYWSPLLLVFLITMGGTLAFYVYSVNAPAIVKSTYADEAVTATWVNLIGLIFLMCLQPVGGWISDRIGRKPLLVFFGVGGVIYTYFLLTYLPKTTNPFATFGLLAVAYIILTGYTSINALVKSEQFPARVRALGVGLGYAVANSVFGGTAPLIFEAMKADNMVPQFIIYVTVTIAISLGVYIFWLRNRGTTYLDTESGHAFEEAAKS
ncbi:MAG TPA: MFS transporter [Stackebrandtia sp.]|jgi:MHS family alpha-ketoglutarate permease-like MFS transporter|uniref:MFS transporter n=1 Tax=Stackebrandtia sp. TaxID=2023065 RepID=UPI002D4469B0|nr:MFS transporter [Stackebrandtia sp.]HZE41512.1 MFS transporter [Stackebrandtia sp.]